MRMIWDILAKILISRNMLINIHKQKSINMGRYWTYEQIYDKDMLQIARQLDSQIARQLDS